MGDCGPSSCWASTVGGTNCDLDPLKRAPNCLSAAYFYGEQTITTWESDEDDDPGIATSVGYVGGPGNWAIGDCTDSYSATTFTEGSYSHGDYSHTKSGSCNSYSESSTTSSFTMKLDDPPGTQLIETSCTISISITNGNTECCASCCPNCDEHTVPDPSADTEEGTREEGGVPTPGGKKPGKPKPGKDKCKGGKKGSPVYPPTPPGTGGDWRDGDGGEDSPICTQDWPASTRCPVLLATGDKVETATDLTISLPGGDFDVTRNYTSNTGYLGAHLVGYNWSLSPFEFIREVPVSGPDTDVHLYYSARHGKVIYNHTSTSPDLWTSPGPSTQFVRQSTLTRGSDTYNTWELVDPGQWSVHFFRTGGDTPASWVGLIAQSNDWYGHTQMFVYGNVPMTSTPRLMHIYFDGDETSAIADLKFTWRPADGLPTEARGNLERLQVFRPAASGTLTNQVDYVYGTGASNLGTAGDLVEVVSWVLMDEPELGSTVKYHPSVTQYRYYGGTSPTTSDARLTGTAATHQLKMVINPEQIEYVAEKLSGTVTVGYAGGVLGCASWLLSQDDNGDITFPTPESGASIVADMASKIVQYSSGKVSVQYTQTSCGCSGSTQGLRTEYTYYSASGKASVKLDEQQFDGTSYNSYRYVYHDLENSWTDSSLVFRPVTMAIIDAGDTDKRWVWHHKWDDTTRDLTATGSPASCAEYLYWGESDGTHTGPYYVQQAAAGEVYFFTYANKLLTELSVCRGWTPSTSGPDPNPLTLVERLSYSTTSGIEYLLTKDELFRTAGSTTDPDAIETTEFAYGFFSTGTNRIAWIQTSVEAELESENGPGGMTTAYTSFDLFDAAGFNIWSQAAAGYAESTASFTYREFDASTGALTRLVRNAPVGGSVMGIPALSTTGYASSPGTLADRYSSSESLETTWTHDLLGRVTSMTVPGGVTTYTVRAISRFPERPNVAYSSELALPFKLPSTTNFAGPATRVWYNAAGSAIGSYDYLVDGTATYTPSSLVYTLGTDPVARRSTQHLLSGVVQSRSEWPVVSESPYVTSYVYDSLGRLDYMMSPTGTITQNFAYDVLGRVLEVKVGTATGSGGDMQTVSQNFFDHTGSLSSPAPGVGDGNLTLVRRFTGETSTGAGGLQLSPSVQDTVREFDFRGRQTTSRKYSSASSSSVPPYEYLSYDNLGRVIARGVFTSEPSGIDSADRVLYTETSYSQRGLVYRQAVAIDADTTSTAGFLESHTWYDAAGHTVGSWGPNGPGAKRQYDGLGRTTKLFVTDRADGSGLDVAPGVSGNYADVFSPASHAAVLTDDHVVEQTEYHYNTSGLTDMVTTLRRLHDSDDSVSGALSSSNAVPTYVCTIYDAAKRPTTTVNYGTNDTPDEFKSGGSAPTIPTSNPTTGTWIASQTVYDVRGRVEKLLSGKGTVTKYVYDDLDRRIAVIENWDNAAVTWNGSTHAWESSGVGGTTDDIDRVTRFEYDGGGHVVMQIAELPSNQFQKTQYVYGGGSVGSPGTAEDTLVASNDLLLEVRYPDESTGAPGSGSTYRVKYSYNRLGELRSTTDQNDTVHVYTRDALGRVTLDSATVASGSPIDEAMRKITAAYDTAGRLKTVETIDKTSSVANTVEFDYTKLWQVENVWQDPDGSLTRSGSPLAPTGNTKVVRYVYDTQKMADGNRSRLTEMDYPDGTPLYYIYDVSSYADMNINGRIGRVSKIETLGTTIQYSYLGLGTFAVVDNAELDVRLDRSMYHDGDSAERHTGSWGHYPGLDRYGRVARQMWADGAIAPPSPSTGLPVIPPIVELAYTYDANSNRLSAIDARPGAAQAGKDWEYTYDGLDRLKTANRGILSGGSVPVGLGSQQWTLDMLGNWNSFKQEKDGDTAFSTTGEDELRDHDRANQLTNRMPSGGGTPPPVVLPFTYDHAGNLRTEDTVASTAGRRFTHDAWNRLVTVDDTGAGGTGSAVTIQSNQYNGLHWRTIATDSVTIDTTVTTRRYMSYSASWQLLEQDVDVAPTSTISIDRRSQQVWGIRYIDDAVMVRNDPAMDGSYPYDYRYHYLTDAQFSVVCVLDSIGRVAERVGYTPYGVARHHWFDDVDGDGDSDQDDKDLITGAANTSIGDPGYLVDADLDRSGTIDKPDELLFGGAKAALPDGLISDPFDGGAMGNPNGVEGPDSLIGYDGYVFNPATLQYTVRFRHYAPGLGRWIERDPMRSRDGVNAYAYVGNSPELYLDPLGLERICGLTVWLLTGGWCEDRTVFDAGWEGYSQAVWDRTNGTLDTVSFGTVDLSTLAGVDFTFDAAERLNAQCVSACFSDSIINTGLPLPPGLSVHVFELDGPVLRLGIDPADWAPATFDQIGKFLDKRYRAVSGRKWKTLRGRPNDFWPSSELGVNMRRRAGIFSAAGKLLQWGYLIQDLVDGCWEKCRLCPAGSSKPRRLAPTHPVPEKPARDYETIRRGRQIL